MNKLKRKIIGSKRYADYMRQFHKRDDGKETNLSKIAQMIWYAQLASDFRMPFMRAGYNEEYDDLTILIDDVHYEVILNPLITNE
jgi:hypothetical protein